MKTKCKFFELFVFLARPVFYFKLVTLSLFASSVLVVGCSSKVHKKHSKELQLKITEFSDYKDDLTLKSFVLAVDKTSKALRKAPNKEMKFGQFAFTQGEYAKHLDSLIQNIAEIKTRGQFYKLVDQSFVFVAFDKKEKSLLTSYFEPVIPGSLRKTKKFSQPLYKKPKSLVKIELGEFREELPQWRKALSGYKQPLSYIRPRGRVESCAQGSCVRPFYSREEIDSGKALNGKKLVLAWVDPVDAFFLQIQGSGQVQFKSGRKMIVNYADQNGHPYYAIGKELTDVIPLKEMTGSKIEAHLRSLPKPEMQSVLNKNASYVFFRRSKQPAVTAMGITALDGRTVAADWHYYPPGLLGFVKTGSLSRFVFVHDKGGAIRGPGRFDLFWGRGKEAQKSAGEVKDPANLWFLVPKDVLKPKL